MSDFKKIIQNGRDFMKFYDNPDFISDQDMELEQPPLAKAPISDERLKLPVDFGSLSFNNDILSIIQNRESHRVYTNETVTLTQLSYLLYATQGVKSIRGKKYATLRTVPSGGARHAFETYLTISNVDGLKNGIYHYLPMTNELEFLNSIENYHDTLGEMLYGQAWASKANVVFFWSMVAYRAEWRYGINAHRIALIDAGHVCQNLYIAAESIGLGTCAIGAFDEDKCNSVFRLDGNYEFIIYAAPVGTIKASNKPAELAFYAFLDEKDE